MPVATSTQAGREVITPAAERVINNATATRAAKLAAAKRAADTLTPLGETPAPFAVESLPDPPLFSASEPAPAPVAPAAPPPRTITLATTVGYRDYRIVVTATGMTLDQFCDMLDKRLGVVS